MTEKQLKDTVQISFPVSVELHARFSACVRHGKFRLLQKAFELLVQRIEEGGYMMIGAIMSGEFDPLFKKEESDEK